MPVKKVLCYEYDNVMPIPIGSIERAGRETRAALVCGQKNVVKIDEWVKKPQRYVLGFCLLIAKI